MGLGLLDRRLIVVVGSGGVGKTTLAAALGLNLAREGNHTLVMTFDPSHRLKDALGVDERAKEGAVRVALRSGKLDVALLDARSTFDQLIQRYAPSPAAAERIFTNRFYRNLAGNLAGILEYMAVERLFEVATEARYDRIILDTPPTKQALDFLEAPDRIVSFLDSGAVRLALSPWFDRRGGLKALPMRLAAKGAEGFLDRIIGRRLLGDLGEFFQALAPLFHGFRERAGAVRRLLRKRETIFMLVAGPGEERIPDTLFFARKLQEAGHHLGPIVVNQTHPLFTGAAHQAGSRSAGVKLFRWLGARDNRGLARLRSLLSKGEPLVEIPLQPVPPTDLPALETLGALLAHRLARA